MNWHKTNVALIAILLIIDAFLGIMLMREYRTARRLPEELINEAIENLSHREILFDEQNIDKNIYRKKVLNYSSKNLFAGEMKQNAEETHPCMLSALAFLSGQSVQSINETVQYFDIPGSTSVSVYKKDGSVFGTASIMGTHTLEFSKSDINTTKLKEKSISLVQSTSFDMPEIFCPRIITDFINSVYDGELGIKAVTCDNFDSGKLYSCVYIGDGLEIDDFSVCFYVKNGNIEYVYGNFLFKKPSEEYNARLVDGINILYSLAERGISANIISEKLAYSLINVDNGQTYIVPVWTISYIDSDNNINSATFNALTGQEMN